MLATTRTQGPTSMVDANNGRNTSKSRDARKDRGSSTSRDASNRRIPATAGMPAITGTRVPVGFQQD
jgi:hypothetical protein